jgi:formylglycine-generating enzyme required for sulfatase activity
MVTIPAGAFLMGSDAQLDRNARLDERSQHTVHLPAYALARTPVTNEQYAAFVRASGHDPPSHWPGGRPPARRLKHPVVRVSWYDARAYCDWLAAVTGKPYRLPSEAEWEKGARGTDGRIYPWGNRWDATRCNTKESGREDASPVALYPQGASPYGLLDMAGNVWEWTSSLDAGYPFQAGDGRQDPDPVDPRVLRGGSWLDFFDSARAACRRSYIPAYHSRLHGFRCCLSGDGSA